MKKESKDELFEAAIEMAMGVDSEKAMKLKRKWEGASEDQEEDRKRPRHMQ